MSNKGQFWSVTKFIFLQVDIDGIRYKGLQPYHFEKVSLIMVQVLGLLSFFFLLLELENTKCSYLLVLLFDMGLPVCKFPFKLVDSVFLSTLSQLQLLSLFSAELIGLCQLNRIFVINWDFTECPELSDIVLSIRTVLEVEVAGAAKLWYLTSQIALDSSTKAECIKDYTSFTSVRNNIFVE